MVQRGAEAVFTPEGQRQIKETIAYYLNNAKVIKQGLTDAGLTVYGGVTQATREAVERIRKIL